MEGSRISLTALSTALFGVGAVLLSVFFPHSIAHEAPRASSIFAVLLLALLAARALSGRAVVRVKASLALAATSLPLAALAVLDAQRPIIAAWQYAQHEEDVAVGLVALVTPAVVAFTTCVGFYVVRRWFPWVVRHGRVVQVAAWLAMASAALGLAVAASHARGVTAESYAGSLPIIARLPANGSGQEVTVGTLLIHRSPGSDGCQFSYPLRAGDCRVSFGLGAPAAAPAEGAGGVGFHWCQELVVRADEKHQVWIVEDDVGQRLAYDAEHLDRPTALRASRLGGAVRYPDAAVGLCVLGLLVAIAVIKFPRRASVSGDGGTLHDAKMRADGMLCLADGSAMLPLPPGPRIAEGPVVVELASSRASFRDSAAPVVNRVFAGTVAEHSFVERHGRYAFALAVVAICAAPLGAAIVVQG